MSDNRESRLSSESPTKVDPGSPTKIKSEAEKVLSREFAFNKTLEEETKQMDNIAKEILRRKDYNARFKHMQTQDNKDPRITFFQQCVEKNNDLNLPILDKILKKTLCLQNYFLSDGNIKGLASACEVLDFRLVNRLLLNNCGITGD